ncbi:MAG: hypothetical protein ACTMIY_07715 [Microbacterium gubbeenense]
MRRGIGGAIVGGVLGALVLVASASAAEDTEVVPGEYVRLVSVADWDRAAGMAPGESMRWDLEISADAPEPGTLAVAMSAAGGTPLVIDAALCLEEWQGETCPGGAEDLRAAWEISRDGELVTLEEFDAADVANLRLQVGVLGGSAGDTTQMRVYAIGAGERVGTGPGLSPTGSWSASPWLLGGGAMLLVGTASLILVRSARQNGGAS